MALLLFGEESLQLRPALKVEARQLEPFRASPRIEMGGQWED